MDAESNLDDTPPTKRMKISPPIHQLPNELLVKIIDKLPRTQWPALELVDHKFRDAVLLAWASVRTVDMEWDFIYSDLKAVENKNFHNYQMVAQNYRRQIARKTKSILKKLSERSPFITSLSGLSLITDDPAVNTTAIQYLAGFEHMKAIKFANKYFSGQVVNGSEFNYLCNVPLINLADFIESTHSRAALKEIYIEQCNSLDDPVMAANFDQRLRAAFANGPPRQLLQLESFSMQIFSERPLTFIDNIDVSNLTNLSLGDSPVEPAALTTLINGAPQLQHLDFAFLQSCNSFRNTVACQGGRLQPNKNLLAALGTHPSLTSLGFNWIWYGTCACHRFEAELKKMLRTIGPQLVNFAFKPGCFPPDIRMGEIRDIIQHHMPNLKSIMLGNVCAEDSEDLRGIADGKDLDEIVFGAFYYSHNQASILNEELLTIIRKSPRLKRFTGVLYSPDQRMAVELCKLSDLIELRIDADQLTEENFIAFSRVQEEAKKLEILHVAHIGEGVESGLIELIKMATQLRDLAVDGNVTDRLLECVAESCPNLEKFCAKSATGITLDGMHMIVDRCPKLRWLYAQNMDRTLARSLKNLNLGRYRKLEYFFSF